MNVGELRFFFVPWRVHASANKPDSELVPISSSTARRLEVAVTVASIRGYVHKFSPAMRRIAAIDGLLSLLPLNAVCCGR